MNTILIVDDESRIRRMLHDFLKNYGYNILEASNGREALDIYFENNNKIDLVLLDVMMPELDGFETLKEIREYSLVPVVMLTAKSEESDEYSGLKCGADDYISKPFSPTILLARIENILRRTKKLDSEILDFGDLSINISSNEVLVDGNAIILTPKEFDLILYLVQNKNIVLKRQIILDSVWNYNYEGDERTVDTHIKQLRSKIGKDYIKTVHGIGYKFKYE